MQLSRYALVLSLTIILTSCYTPPQQHDAESERVISLSKDRVWSNIMEWFTSNKVQIKTVEKDSGIIYAEAMYSLPMPVADCGRIEDKAILPRVGQFNVFVRELGKNSVKVTVNAAFASSYQDQWDGGIRSVTCVSKGAVEQTILDAAAQ